MTQTTYIEPEGFKGTPGEFYRNNTYVMISGTGKDVAICATKTMDAKFQSSGYHPSVLQEIRMNAQLFAASKDILKALYELKSDLFYQISAKHGPEKAANYPSILQAEAIAGINTFDYIDSLLNNWPTDDYQNM